jgi:hypothetical protein
MPRQSQQCGAQHQLGGPDRPLAFTFDRFQPLHEAADVERHAGKLRPHRFDSTVDGKTRRHRAFSQIGDPAT